MSSIVNLLFYAFTLRLSKDPTGSSGPDKNSPFSMMYLCNAYASEKCIPRRIRTMFRWPWWGTLLGGNSFDITSLRSSSEEQIALLKNSHYLHYSFTFFRFLFWCKCSPNSSLIFRGRISCLRVSLSNCLTVGFRFSHCCYKRSYGVVSVFNPRHTCMHSEGLSTWSVCVSLCYC